MKPFPTSTETSSGKALWLALQLAWELGYLIAIPVLVFGLGGSYLDKMLGTSPFLMLGGFLLAAVLSSIAVWRRVRSILRSS